ncbi:MAG: GntR family transcriptional regulator [Clostridiaceae bacterium]|nr:GntR family transcriptional regulator [Clostridiaceae bacterium]
MSRYKEIKNNLLQYILQLPENEKLPPVRELMKKFNTSQVTLDKAFFELKNEGIITTHVGRGTFVSKQGVYPKSFYYRTIGMIISDPKVLYESIIINGAVKKLHDEGYCITIFPTSIYNYGNYEFIKKAAGSRSICGWIIIPNYNTMYDSEFHKLVNEYISKHSPFVSIDHLLTANSSMTIYVDYYLSGKQLGNIFLRENIKRIGFIWNPNSNPCQQRLNGIIEAGRENPFDIWFIQYKSNLDNYGVSYIEPEEVYRAYESGVNTFVISNPLLISSFLKLYYEGINTGRLSEKHVKVAAYIEPGQQVIIPGNFIKIKKPSVEIGEYAAESIIKLVKKEDIILPKYFKCTIEVPENWATMG